MKKSLLLIYFSAIYFVAVAQLSWKNLDSLYQPLPSSVHVYKSTDQLDGKPNIVYYVIADLEDKTLSFTADTTYKRRLTPSAFYEKDNQPLVVVNCSFFSFATNQNLNVVVKNNKLVGYNIHTIPAKGKDTLMYYHSFFGAFGISTKRKADIAWVYTDSSKRYPYASEHALPSIHDSVAHPSFNYLDHTSSVVSDDYNGNGYSGTSSFKKWKMKTAIGGGPVLLQNGEIDISNNEERNFTEKQLMINTRELQ